LAISKIIQAVQLSVSWRLAISGEFSGRFWQSRFYDFNQWASVCPLISLISLKGFEPNGDLASTVQAQGNQCTRRIPSALS
jgi:hypothetical protein